MKKYACIVLGCLVGLVLFAGDDSSFQEWLKRDREAFDTFTGKKKPPAPAEKPASRLSTPPPTIQARAVPRKEDAVEQLWYALLDAYLPAAQAEGAEREALCRRSVELLRVVPQLHPRSDRLVLLQARFYLGMSLQALGEERAAADEYVAILREAPPLSGDRHHTGFVGCRLQARRRLRDLDIALTHDEQDMIYEP